MIKPIPYYKTIPFHNLGKKHGLMFNENTNYIGYFKGKILCGVAGYDILKSKSIIRSAFVLEDYRGKGFYNELVEFRLNKIKERGKTNVIESTCTVNSLQYHLKRGAKVIKEYKKYTKIQYILQ